MAGIREAVSGLAGHSSSQLSSSAEPHQVRDTFWMGDWQSFRGKCKSLGCPCRYFQQGKYCHGVMGYIA